MHGIQKGKEYFSHLIIGQAHVYTISYNTKLIEGLEELIILPKRTKLIITFFMSIDVLSCSLLLAYHAHSF